MTHRFSLSGTYARACAGQAPNLQEINHQAGAHTVTTIPLRAARKEASANALHVHEEWKLVPGHMGNGRNVLPRHDKPVLKRARVLRLERYHLRNRAHVSAGVLFREWRVARGTGKTPTEASSYTSRRSRLPCAYWQKTHGSPPAMVVSTNKHPGMLDGAGPDEAWTGGVR